MQNLHLSTLSGKFFWGSLLIYCIAFFAFYFLTQHSHQALVKTETSGVFANLIKQNCPVKLKCGTWQFKHEFSRESKKLDAVLAVPYQYFKKVDAAQFQTNYTKRFEQLPWNVKRQLSGKLNVVAVNIEVKKQK